MVDKRLVNSLPSHKFQHTAFSISDFEVHFVRGIPCSSASTPQYKKYDSDIDSKVSLSSEDIQVSKEESDLIDSFNKDLCKLFQLEEDAISTKPSISRIPPLNKSVIPSHLPAIVDACGIVLG